MSPQGVGELSSLESLAIGLNTLQGLIRIVIIVALAYY